MVRKPNPRYVTPFAPKFPHLSNREMFIFLKSYTLKH